MAIIQEIIDELSRVSDAGQSVALNIIAAPKPGACRGMAPNFVAAALPDTDAQTLRPESGKAIHELVVGEELVIKLQSPVDGYLSLFNLGTSGSVNRIFPGSTAQPLFISGGQWYAIPGPGFEISNWIEKGPTTEDRGFKEQILAVILAQPKVLTEHDLHTDIPLARTRGMNISEGISDLYDLPPDQVSYGLLSLPVVAPRSAGKDKGDQ